MVSCNRYRPIVIIVTATIYNYFLYDRNDDLAFDLVVVEITVGIVSPRLRQPTPTFTDNKVCHQHQQIILIHIEKNLTCSKDKVGSGVGLLVVKGVVLLPAALLDVE